MFKFEFIEPGIGRIVIDDFIESFESDHSYWNVRQYENHWKESKLRLKNGDSAFFFTSITEPSNSNFFRTWVGYPINGKFVFQENLLFLDQLAFEIDPKDPHHHIDPYSATAEDGMRVSEWVTDE